MIFDILTLFPDFFTPFLSQSILKRAQDKSLIKINIHNLRKWTKDKRKTVDDKPFGGGPGMVLMPEPIFKAIEDLREKETYIILLSPQGKVFNQSYAKKLLKYKHLILICGHYEGVDERIRTNLIDEEISIGDYILMGGELPAMVLIDCISRLIPGVLGNEFANVWESFENYLLEYPQYTRPANFRGLRVPEILLSGKHKEIEKWRYEKALEKTKKLRPDLYHKYVKEGKYERLSKGNREKI
jgi:tRNA (guanine37-N1)-methyltransferase